MAETLWRSRSKDHMIDFASYFDTNKPRMKEIVSQLDEICEETRERKDEVPSRATRAAGVGGLVGVGGGLAAALLLAPLTGGLSLAVAAGSAAVVGSAGAVRAARAVVVRDRITDSYTLEKVKDLVTEFCELVKPLKDVHREKRQMFKTLDRKIEKILIILPTLIDGLNALFINFKADSTVQRLLEVTEQCRDILEKLEELAEQVKLEKLKELELMKLEELMKL